MKRSDHHEMRVYPTLAAAAVVRCESKKCEDERREKCTRTFDVCKQEKRWNIYNRAMGICVVDRFELDISFSRYCVVYGFAVFPFFFKVCRFYQICFEPTPS